MERHVEYSRDVLASIEFDLPVLPAIIQMNERQDGKGYPECLLGDGICLHARILAVANAFCAMLRPRSYRPALPLDKVLDALESQTDSYDVNVVHALRDVLDTPAGERLLGQIGGTATGGGNGEA
jgi:HD-GYP domain-containing protein (c-di-GMP phosphodiesterase class II)